MRKKSGNVRLDLTEREAMLVYLALTSQSSFVHAEDREMLGSIVSKIMDRTGWDQGKITTHLLGQLNNLLKKSPLTNSDPVNNTESKDDTEAVPQTRKKRKGGWPKGRPRKKKL